MSGYRNLLVGGAIVSALVFGSGAVYAEGDLKAKAIIQSQETAGSQEMRLEDIIKDESAADSFRKSGGTLEEALKFEDIRRENPNMLLSDREIALFRRYGGTVEEAKEFINIKYKGSSIILWNYIIKLKKHGATAKYTKRLAGYRGENGNRVFDNFTIYRFAQLGLSLEQVLYFRDTEKPNAVVIYPTEDWTALLEDRKSIDFFNTIKEKYDTWVRIASKEKQVYNAITFVPNVKLLILAGHGTETALSLGENDLRVREAENDERYMIDTGDDEFQQYLDKLSPDAVIFLLSCSTAEGGKDANNLANKIIDMAGGRKVIAATCLINTDSINIKSVYPFDVILNDLDTGNDCTYSNK